MGSSQTKAVTFEAYEKEMGMGKVTDLCTMCKKAGDPSHYFVQNTAFFLPKGQKMDKSTQKAWMKIQKDMPADTKMGKVKHLVQKVTAAEDLGIVVAQKRHQQYTFIKATDVAAFKVITFAVSDLLGLCGLAGGIAKPLAANGVGQVVLALASGAKDGWYEKHVRVQVEAYTFAFGLITKDEDAGGTLVQVFEFTITGDKKEGEKFWGLIKYGEAHTELAVETAAILMYED